MKMRFSNMWNSVNYIFVGILILSPLKNCKSGIHSYYRLGMPKPVG